MKGAPNAVAAGLRHALTVDVEEYFQVEALASRVLPQDWPSFPSRVEASTQRVLDMLASVGAKATFFVVGWVAERHPELVRQIAAAGHEIGCHSYAHRHLARLTPESFRQDTLRALAALQDAVGVRALGYRAPTFSITPSTLWALEILADLGFRYDSSVYPIHHDLYGMPHAPRSPFAWSFADGRQLYEFPGTTTRLAGVNLPCSGGGYLRLLPAGYTRWALRRVERERQPAMIYFHPWELDPGQPRVAGLGWRARLRHYRNLDSMEVRLRALFQSRRWTTMWEALQARLDAAPLTTVSAPSLGQTPAIAGR